jgi:hypothetical protein
LVDSRKAAAITEDVTPADEIAKAILAPGSRLGESGNNDDAGVVGTRHSLTTKYTKINTQKMKFD